MECLTLSEECYYGGQTLLRMIRFSLLEQFDSVLVIGSSYYELAAFLMNSLFVFQTAAASLFLIEILFFNPIIILIVVVNAV